MLMYPRISTFIGLLAGVPGFDRSFKNAVTFYKIYQAELIIFARFVYTSQTIFKHSEQTTYDTYIQNTSTSKFLLNINNYYNEIIIKDEIK